MPSDYEREALRDGIRPDSYGTVARVADSELDRRKTVTDGTPTPLDMGQIVILALARISEPVHFTLTD